MLRFLLEKKYLSILIVFLQPLSVVCAANISIMVVEAGAGAITAKGTAELWEDSIMNIFFNDGHIVSNARSKQMLQFPAEEFPEEALRDLQDASEGGSDFFVLALLGYGDNIPDMNTKPEIILLRLYAISPYRFLLEEQVVNKKNLTYEGSMKQLEKAVNNLISFIARNKS